MFLVAEDPLPLNEATETIATEPEPSDDETTATVPEPIDEKWSAMFDGSADPADRKIISLRILLEDADGFVLAPINIDPVSNLGKM